MEMTVSTILWKYMLLSASVAISLVGVGVISFGVLAFGGAGSQVAAYLVTLLGFWLFTICFVGCCAALRESYSLAMAFIGTAIGGVVVSAILIIAVAAVQGIMTESMIERVDDVWNHAEEQWDTINFFQMQYHCCGKESGQEYADISDGELPLSCFLNKDNSNPNNLFTRGCLMSAKLFIGEQTDYLILSLVGSIALEVCGIVAAFFLAKSVQHRVAKVEEPIVVTHE